MASSKNVLKIPPPPAGGKKALITPNFTLPPHINTSINTLYHPFKQRDNGAGTGCVCVCVGGSRGVSRLFELCDNGRRVEVGVWWLCGLEKQLSLVYVISISEPGHFSESFLLFQYL
jgi:hypothetical protein